MFVELFALLALAFPGDAPPVEITVYAAASLRDSLQAIAPDYEKASGTKIVFNFGSSGDLARQVVAANKADLFFSADEKEMDRVAADGRIEEGTRRVVLSNQLVVIEWIDPEDPPSSLFLAPFEPSRLTRPHIKRLSLADPATVPAGRYAKEWLEKVKVWPYVQDRVIPGVDVRAALAAVESGAAQVGIVYKTDAAISKKVRVVHAVPLTEGPSIRYVLAVLKDRPNAREVHALADHLAGAESRTVFVRFGFVVPDPTPEAKPKSEGK